MSILSENLRYMRGQRKLSQQQLANELIIGRGRYSKNEDGKSESPLEILRRISNHFHVSIDLLVAIDLQKVTIADLLDMDYNKTLTIIKNEW